MSPIWNPVELNMLDLDIEDPEEQMGSKDKNWIRIVGDDRRRLVKIARTDVRDGTTSGEDRVGRSAHCRAARGTDSRSTTSSV
ncbi:hypothetical protein MZK47_16415 [Microbacterium aerolatum]|uniref:hypothetical protein n=1 Tax=Microbacterium aerolatum TaxID=153731 RepID=UPI002000A476|nr:hypothetical protein [Microbacterium aerolatum]MCK3771251.1 hypothetical protein [Microbacterium aerolatum]